MPYIALLTECACYAAKGRRRREPLGNAVSSKLLGLVGLVGRSVARSSARMFVGRNVDPLLEINYVQFGHKFITMSGPRSAPHHLP